MLGTVISELGSPRTLREVGVVRERLDGLVVAENIVRDRGLQAESSAVDGGGAGIRNWEAVLG